VTITTQSQGASGCLFIIAAPSGGSDEPSTRALEREPGISASVSFTTRPPCPGEEDGVHYHFVACRASWLRGEGASRDAHVHGNWVRDRPLAHSSR
jgi:guanylate kinase